jgi:hypothetical protein
MHNQNFLLSAVGEAEGIGVQGVNIGFGADLIMHFMQVRA